MRAHNTSRLFKWPNTQHMICTRTAVNEIKKKNKKKTKKQKNPQAPLNTPLIITKTRLFKYIEIFTSKNWKFSDKNIFHISAQKHRLWVLVRTASMMRF